MYAIYSYALHTLLRLIVSKNNCSLTNVRLFNVYMYPVFFQIQASHIMADLFPIESSREKIYKCVEEHQVCLRRAFYIVVKGKPPQC